MHIPHIHLPRHPANVVQFEGRSHPIAASLFDPQDLSFGGLNTCKIDAGLVRPSMILIFLSGFSLGCRHELLTTCGRIPKFGESTLTVTFVVGIPISCLKAVRRWDRLVLTSYHGRLDHIETHAKMLSDSIRHYLPLAAVAWMMKSNFKANPCI